MNFSISQILMHSGFQKICNKIFEDIFWQLFRNKILSKNGLKKYFEECAKKPGSRVHHRFFPLTFGQFFDFFSM